MDLSTPAAIAILIASCFLLSLAALWLALKRLRRWKEQVLHATSVLQSNSHQDHLTTRAETALLLEQKLQRQLEERDGEFAGALTPLREELSALREQMSLRKLVGSHADVPRLEEVPAPNHRYREYIGFLQSLDHANEGSRYYLTVHLHRTARTLAAAPSPNGAGRALELGAYGFMASALRRVNGYREVRCAYLGETGQSLSRPVSSHGEEIFRCDYDLFDAERDRFPYPDGHFELVLACEIIEHLTRDPMHMLLECARVLSDGGVVVVTTPNVASYSSVARALTAAGNPQIYALYPYAETESPHVREYTAGELRDAVVAAGFAIEYLFTEKIAGCDADTWVAPLLRDCHLPTALRGEQLYCVARKRSGAPTNRFPAFLYEARP